MGLDDFCRCTPAEFSAIAKRWMEMRQQQRREQWEQTRMTCLCLLQPYSKKKLTPRDVMRFDWDNEPKETHEEEQPREQLTTEEIKRRYREAMEKRGLIVEEQTKQQAPNGANDNASNTEISFHN